MQQCHPTHVYLEICSYDLKYATHNEAGVLQAQINDFVQWLLTKDVQLVIVAKILQRLNDQRLVRCPAKLNVGMYTAQFEEIGSM